MFFLTKNSITDKNELAKYELFMTLFEPNTAPRPTFSTMNEMYDFFLQTVKDYLNSRYAEIELASGRTAKSVKLDMTEIIMLLTYVFDMKLINLNSHVNESADKLHIGVYKPADDFNHQGKGLYDLTLFKQLYNMLSAQGNMSRNITYKLFESAVMGHLFQNNQIVQLTETPYKTIVNNGIYNHATHELEPFTPDYIAITKLTTNYNPHATLPVIHISKTKTWDVDLWLKGLAGKTAHQYDRDTYNLFWQIIRSAINPYGINQKTLIFYAESGNNGKGTFGQLIKNIIGYGNYSSVSLADFGKDFRLEPLIGSHLNIADENAVDGYIDDLTALKNITTGDDITINRKNKSVITTRITLTNIQMMNSLPKTKDKTDSLYRRFRFIPFLTSFTNNGENPAIKNDYINRPDVKEYVLKKALELEPFVEFINPKRSQVLLNDYKEDNDPVVEFWNEFHNQFKWTRIPSAFAYDLFKAWFEQNNPRQMPLKRNTFLKSTKNWMTSNTNSGWLYRASASQKMHIKNEMDADEPLITEYKLENWYNPTYSGSDARQKRNFPRPNGKTVRGFMCKPTKQTTK